MLLILDLDTAPDIERPNAFRSVKLVGGQGEQIDAQCFNIEREYTRSLDGVGVKQDAMTTSDAPNLGERLDGADFVAGVHHGNETGLGADRALDVRRVEPSVRIDWKAANCESLSFQPIE